MKKFHYLFFLLIFLYLSNVTFDRVKGSPRAIISSDAEGYYTYLPSLFILKDFHHVSPGNMWPYYNDKGEFVIKFTCGVAYFELPFFGIGYLISRHNGFDLYDFFNPNYCNAIAFGGIFISFLGLLLLFKTLIQEHKVNIAFWTL